MGDIELELAPTPDAARQARGSIKEVFGDEIPAATLHDLLVVVTELVTNSVKYGPGGAIEVRLSVSPAGLVRGEVRDQGANGARPAIRDSPLLVGGLGLRIVDALTERWAVDDKPGTRVWFEVRFS